MRQDRIIPRIFPGSFSRMQLLSFAGKSFDTAYRFFLERGSRAHWHWHCPLSRPAYLPPSVHEPMRTCRPTSPARCPMALRSSPALPRARLVRWFPKFTGFSKENHSDRCLRAVSAAIFQFSDLERGSFQKKKFFWSSTVEFLFKVFFFSFFF